MTADPDSGIEVDGDAIRRRWAPTRDPAAPLPGAGTGLIGLVERVGSGGRLGWSTAGRPTGEFRLRAWLPWPAGRRCRGELRARPGRGRRPAGPRRRWRWCSAGPADMRAGGRGRRRRRRCRRRWREHAPDVVLMDIRMPQVDGLTATERLRARPGRPEVIVLTTFDADDHGAAGAARRCQRVPAQGHPAGRDRGRRAAGGRGRADALPHRHPPAHVPRRGGRGGGRWPRHAAGHRADAARPAQRPRARGGPRRRAGAVQRPDRGRGST